MKNKHDIDKAFVSPEDRFLVSFDQTHVCSASQLQEIKQHERIACLRDQVQTGKAAQEIWEGF